MTTKMRWICNVWQGDAEAKPSYMNAKQDSIHDRITFVTGLARTSADLDPRRRKVLYRCWHRGIREMDLVFGSFAESEIGSLSDVELDEFEEIMDEDDHDLHAWITGAAPVPMQFQTPLFARIAAFVPDFSPVTDETLKDRFGNL